jgi:DNA-binding response OmpR family regulator
MKVLLVEDDELLAGVVAEFLTDHLHVVEVVTDGESAWNQISALEYDLILLDVMLPKLDGIRLCQRLRSHGYSVPVLMITARDTSTDKVLGLDAGADDYMVKPLDFPELLARIRALLRRGSSVSSPILEWGELHLDPATYEVSYHDNTLRLTPKEYKLWNYYYAMGDEFSAAIQSLKGFGLLRNPQKRVPSKLTLRVCEKNLKWLALPLI